MRTRGFPQGEARIRHQPERDPAVDVLKGVACLLMAVAHVHFSQAPWLQYVTMAAVLFFATTGMNLVAIVERRSGQETRLAVNALFLIFAGFANNYVQDTLRMCDVLQSAGMAMLAMLFLRRLWASGWTWLFPVPFLIHFVNQQVHWKTQDGGVSSFFITPGLFPLLPWLSFYLFGAHLKRFGVRGLGWIFGASALVALASLSLFRPFHFDKFWMSPEYFLIGCGVTAFSFASVRRWVTDSRAQRLPALRRWGANSLVFYIANNFVIRGLEMLMPHGAALLLLSLVVTALLLRPLLALQSWAARQRPGTVLAGGAAVALAVVVANRLVWPQSLPLFTLASFGLMFAFIAVYAAWKNVSRALAIAGAPARQDVPERVLATPAFTD